MVNRCKVQVVTAFSVVLAVLMAHPPVFAASFKKIEIDRNRNKLKEARLERKENRQTIKADRKDALQAERSVRESKVEVRKDNKVVSTETRELSSSQETRGVARIETADPGARLTDLHGPVQLQKRQADKPHLIEANKKAVLQEKKDVARNTRTVLKENRKFEKIPQQPKVSAAPAKNP